MKKLGLIFGIIIGLIVFGAFKKKSKDNSKPKISATEFVAELERLGYYKYADKKNIDSGFVYGSLREIRRGFSATDQR